MRENHAYARRICTFFLFLILLSRWSTRAEELFVPLEPPLSGFGVINPVEGLNFIQPVATASPPNETNRLFIVERPGTIVVITNLAIPTRSVFLDLRAATESRNLEAGLLGMEFHPGFATNGYFYVFWMTYTSTSGFTNVLHDRISRFQVSATDPNVANRASEVAILSQPDFSSTHNAGDLKFGPDGYLYVSLGDSDPPVSQTGEKAQSLDKGLFGGILRIDVDNRPGNLPPNFHSGVTTNYSIPADNPFIGFTNFFGTPVAPENVRTEFYALGLRNPWRFCFKPGSSEIYCADVGNDLWEEINLVTAGGNYGWPYFEGTNQYRIPPAGFLHTPTPPAGFVQSAPLLTYLQGPGTNEGYSVIGGLFYEGDSLPGLKGKYIFGDYRSGHIWATSFDGTMQRVTGIQKGLAAFGKDPRDDGILMVNHWDGTIGKLIYVPPESAAPFPETLSATGIFSDTATLTPHEGLIPYQINAPFWSDYAIKKRWFRLPDSGEKIQFRTIGPWKWPTGSIFVKHFDLELTNGVSASRHRLETRLLVKTEDSVYGVTYRWNESQTDAILVPDEGAHETFAVVAGDSTRVQQWRYPSRNECMHCHTASAGFVLGPETLQLNREVRTENGLKNQITFLSESDCFEAPPAELASLQRLVALDDADEPLEKRARSYFAANCAGCHNPSEGLWDYGAFRDARFTTRLPETGLLGRAIVPNQSRSSLLYNKLSFNGPHRMPPIGSTELDRRATNVIFTWIDSFPPSPWLRADVATIREGSTTVQNGVYEITGAGQGFSAEADSFHFLSRPLDGSGDFLARFQKFLGQTSAEAGIAMRLDTNPGGPSAVLTANQSGIVTLRVRKEVGGTPQEFSVQVTAGPVFLRLARSGPLVTAFASPNGTIWQEVGRSEWIDSSQIAAGLVISSLDPLRTATAHIDDVQIRTIAFIDPAPASNYSLPAAIPIRAQISGEAVELLRVYANGTLIHETNDLESEFLWNNATPGAYTLQLAALDSNGLELRSDPLLITIDSVPRAAAFSGVSPEMGGTWQTHFGNAGFNVLNGATNPLQGLTITYAESEIIGIPVALDDTRLLSTLDGGRSTNVLEGLSTIRLHFNSSITTPNRLTLYFLDWNNLGRIQEIVLRDSIDGRILDQRLISNFQMGKYLTWSFTGDIEVEVIAKGLGSAVLSGWFFDSLNPPEVALLEPSQDLSIPAGASLVFSGSIQLGTAEFDRLELAANGTVVAQNRDPVFRFEWVPRSTGTYEMTLIAYDKELGVSTPRTVRVEVLPIAASAKLINIDNVTQGTWKGIYGTRGWAIPVIGENLPANTRVSLTGAIPWVWENPTEDLRALQHPSLQTRAATVWQNFLTTLRYQVTSSDPHPRLVSLYVVDYNSGSRRQRLQITDVSGNELLSTEVSDFYFGRYYTFEIQGDVVFYINPLTDHPLLSGVFFDPPGKAPAISIVSPNPDSTYSSDEPIAVKVEAIPDDEVATIDFFANGELIRTLVDAPYELTTKFTSGTYLLTAKVTDRVGESAVSDPITIQVVSPDNAPMIAIISPIQGSVLPAAEPIEIEAYTLPQNAQLEIEYFANEELLGKTSGPHTLSTTLGPGAYRLTAKATDQSGLIGHSAAVNIEVYRSQPPEFVNISTLGDSVILRVSPGAEAPHILEASVDLRTWLPISTNSLTGPNLQFEVAGPTSPQFFRVSVRR